MFKSIMCASLFTTLIAIPAAHAGRRHGTACQPALGSQGKIVYSEAGAGNSDPLSVAEVFCPLEDTDGRHYAVDAFGNSAAPSTASVWLLDQSTTGSAYCYIWATNEDTDSAWGPTRHTCTSAGGCDGVAGGEAATGYREIAFSDNVVDRPLAYFGPNYFDAFGVRCYLPKPVNGLRTSVKMLDTRYGYIDNPF